MKNNEVLTFPAMFDKTVENEPPSHYGPRFHSVAIKALEEVKE